MESSTHSADAQPPRPRRWWLRAPWTVDQNAAGMDAPSWQTWVENTRILEEGMDPYRYCG